MTAPPPPVCIFCVFGVASYVSKGAEVELSLGWTVAVRVEEGTVTVTIPPPPVAFDVASDVFFNSGEVESSLG